MSDRRCGHFSLEIEYLRVPRTQIPLRVPVRRCALAEHMVMLLLRSEEGKIVASKLTAATSRPTLTGEEAASANSIRVAFGPDLEAVHAPNCTVSRCQESCTPGYRMLLSEFGYALELGSFTEADCMELTALVEESPGS